MWTWNIPRKLRPLATVHGGDHYGSHTPVADYGSDDGVGQAVTTSQWDISWINDATGHGPGTLDVPGPWRTTWAGCPEGFSPWRIAPPDVDQTGINTRMSVVLADDAILSALELICPFLSCVFVAFLRFSRSVGRSPALTWSTWCHGSVWTRRWHWTGWTRPECWSSAPVNSARTHRDGRSRSPDPWPLPPPHTHFKRKKSHLSCPLQGRPGRRRPLWQGGDAWGRHVEELRREKVYNDSSMRRNPEWHRSSLEQKLWWIFELSWVEPSAP